MRRVAPLQFQVAQSALNRFVGGGSAALATSSFMGSTQPHQYTAVSMRGFVSKSGGVTLSSVAAKPTSAPTADSTAASFALKQTSSINRPYSFTASAIVPGSVCSATSMAFGKRHFRTSNIRLCEKPKDGAASAGSENNALQGTNSVKAYTSDEDDNKDNHDNPYGEQNAEQGYMPFPPPFHTVNIVMILFLGNIFFYLLMNFSGSDEIRDFAVEHFTLSHENYHLIYPFFTSSLYQEQILQLVIDCWLLYQFGNSVLGFLGGKRLLAFWAMTSVGGGLLHIGRQKFELYYGHDPLEVRGRCFGPNPFILGLVGVEGLIFRHLNFMQNPPVPFLVMTAFVMIIDVWRIFTTKPEEHGAPTGGALVAYIFWALPTKLFGLSRLTASM